MDRDTVSVAASAGHRRLVAWVRRAGRDLVVVLEGGDAPHVGCVVLSQARPSTANPERVSVTTSVLAMPPHKEEPVARTVAELLARELGCVVVATAGIHEDGLDPAGIGVWLELTREVASRLVECLRGTSPG